MHKTQDAGYLCIMIQITSSIIKCDLATKREQQIQGEENTNSKSSPLKEITTMTSPD